MKKLVLISALVTILLITGCGKTEKLVCSQKVAMVDVDMIADWKNNELNYLGLKYTMDLSGYNDTQVEAVNKQNMCETVKKAMSSYQDAFTNCKQKLENKKLVITADFDIDKMPNSEIGRKSTKEEAVKQLEKQGYTCK